MLNYELADCLTRIRNAYMKRHKDVHVRKTKLNMAVLAVLKEQGAIADFAADADSDRTITIVLKYANSRPAMKSIKCVSRPGLRVYYSSQDIPRYKSGLAYGVISTSKGVMTSQQAKAAGVGGELLCVVE